MNFSVYMLLNLRNGKIYIGKSKNPFYRLQEHINTARTGSRPVNRKFQIIHKAISKYGINNFEFRIIHYFSSEEDSLLAEKYWIEYYKTNIIKYGNEFGYNLTDGGDGVSGHIHSIETKHKMSVAQAGRLNHNFGKKLSTNTKRKISINNHFAILTIVEVREIRKLFHEGWLQKNLAIKFNVKQNTISSIINFKTWKLI